MRNEIREILTEFGSTSPTRDLSPKKGEELKETRKEVYEHIDHFTNQILNLIRERLPKKEELWKTDTDRGKDDGNRCGYGMMAKQFENEKIKKRNEVIDEIMELLK